MVNIIGNPLESTLAVSHLIFGGVLDRHPKLKFCVAHGGGYLAHYAARMDHGWKVRPDARTVLKKKPSVAMRPRARASAHAGGGVRLGRRDQPDSDCTARAIDIQVGVALSGTAST